jgi:hypothetical protein
MSLLVFIGVKPHSDRFMHETAAKQRSRGGTLTALRTIKPVIVA